MAVVDQERRLTGSIFDRLGGVHETYGILLPLVLTFIGFSLAVPHFVAISNLKQVALSVSITGVLVVGQAPVVITRNIDLSVESIVGFCAFFAGDLLKNGTMPLAAVLILTLLVGAAMGAVNGLLVAFAEVPSIVATLATLAIYRGLDNLIFGSGQINARDVPTAYLSLTSGSIGPIPIMVVYPLAAVALGAWVLDRRRAGRELYAIGSNRLAAGIIGIPVRARVMSTFVVSGLVAAVGGILWGSFYQTIQGTAATGIALPVIAAVVVGGVSVNGGGGRMFGALLGALLLGVFSNGLAVANLSSYWAQAVDGAIILVGLTIGTGLHGRALHRRRTVMSEAPATAGRTA